MLIFSHQRCGSTSLLSFLRRACDTRGRGEPFNRKDLSAAFPEWKSLPHAELQAYFESVFERFPIIKHIYRDHEPRIDRLVVEAKPVKAIVFLSRENTEAAALSAAMAKRSKNYRDSASHLLGSIPIKEIRAVSEDMARCRRIALEICLDSGKHVISQTYEGLFVDDVHEREQRLLSLLDEIRESTGIGLAGRSAFRAAFDAYVRPSNKINSMETYEMVDNWEELRNAFPSIVQ